MPLVSHTFAPVFNSRSRLLILGTMPSVKSREMGFYYGHPRNRFWQVLAALADTQPPVTVTEKKAFLLSHGVAIWDVLHSCEIHASSDASIRQEVPNDMREILSVVPIARIYCNGAATYRMYEKHCLTNTGIEAVQLPSTSPANAAFSLERLVALWEASIGKLTPVSKLENINP